eukprot:7503666-Pyramimonas_sp.AAC.1
MKNVEIRFLALQQCGEQKRLEYEQILTDDNSADMLTKPMTQESDMTLVGHMASNSMSKEYDMGCGWVG